MALLVVVRFLYMAVSQFVIAFILADMTDGGLLMGRSGADRHVLLLLGYLQYGCGWHRLREELLWLR